MDLKKTELLLEKINRLFKSMSIDEEGISSIERDLMLSYIQQFYEYFLDDSNVSSPRSNSKKTFTPPTPQKRPSFEPAEPEPRKNPPPPPPKEPVFEVVEPPKEQAPPKPEPKQEPVREQQPPKPSYYTPPQPTEKVDSGEHDHLFEQEQGKELADKLGDAPIRDLTKAFSINDRLFNINELFGGDQSAFLDTINRLNTMRSFEDAKSYLSTSVADKYNWTDKDKKSTAKNFIKVVRRRFK